MSRSYKITREDLPNKRRGWCKCSYCVNGKLHKNAKAKLSEREQIKEQQAA